ncbi:MAG: phosphotransferase family protein [Myxococcales bacterium]|nr:phosphotransferase family protein [Myxococcales bacterium]MDH3484446.1 phosphotransferase family protein [Myxococcales bacterium]
MGFADEERDLDETARKLVAWLAPHLSLPEESVRIENLEAPLSTGFSSDTLLFDLTCARGGETREEGLVARLEPEEYVMFPTYDIALQARVLQGLEKTGVPVPKVRWFEPDESVLGVPFYIMERVEGRIPSDNPPMHDEGWIVEELSESEREKLWWNGFEAMCKVHGVSWKGHFDFLLEPERGDTPLDQQLDYYQGYFRWGMEASRHPDIVKALEYLETNKPAKQPIALCWGDSRLANQIFDGLECVALLDWEMVRLGDPVQDLAWWLASDRCFTEGLELERLAGFPSAAETMARWQEITGFDVSSFDYYTILALTRFSMQMARVGQYMKKIEIIDEENEFDAENLASVTLRRALAEVR